MSKIPRQQKSINLPIKVWKQLEAWRSQTGLSLTSLVVLCIANNTHYFGEGDKHEDGK